jgi:hypothetical protein
MRAADVLQAISEPGHTEQISKRAIMLPQFIPLFAQQPFTRKYHFKKLQQEASHPASGGGSGGGSASNSAGGFVALGRGKKRKSEAQGSPAQVREEEESEEATALMKVGEARAMKPKTPSQQVQEAVESVHSPRDRAILRGLLLPSSALPQCLPFSWLDWTDYDPSNAIVDVLAQVLL